MGCPLTPPLVLARCTASSALMRIKAPSMAPTPVTSSSTPILIGVPVGAPPAGAEDPAGAVVFVGAGPEQAASTIAKPPSQATFVGAKALDLIRVYSLNSKCFDVFGRQTGSDRFGCGR